MATTRPTPAQREILEHLVAGTMIDGDPVGKTGWWAGDLSVSECVLRAMLEAHWIACTFDSGHRHAITDEGRRAVARPVEAGAGEQEGTDGRSHDPKIGT
jgi:hypothetical protein